MELNYLNMISNDEPEIQMVQMVRPYWMNEGRMIINKLHRHRQEEEKEVNQQLATALLGLERNARRNSRRIFQHPPSLSTSVKV
jgi:hypothetical protein